MKGIIPTGGRGTRMQPMSLYTNKHFIPVGNKPLIYYPIEALANAGIKDIAITYNPGGLSLAQQYLGDGSKWGVKFTYIEQKEPKSILFDIGMFMPFLYSFFQKFNMFFFLNNILTINILIYQLYDRF